jgi:membrane-bound metal-dependent hydrolase YbcI (DUF457 family)
MDNVTISLWALMYFRLMGHRNGWQALVVVLLANGLDLDRLLWVVSPEMGMRFALMWTHNLVAAAVLTAAAWPMGRGVMGVTAAGVLTHLGLDALAWRGTAVLFPFSMERWAGDVLPETDAWFWMLAVFFLAAQAVAELVASEIGARRGRAAGLLVIAVMLGAGYVGLRAWCREDARGQFEQALAGAAIERVRIAAPGLSWTEWAVAAETPGGYLVGSVRAFAPATGDLFRRVAKPEASGAIVSASKHRLTEAFLGRSGFPYWREGVSPNPEARRVRVGDLLAGQVSSRDPVVVCEVAATGPARCSFDAR